MDFAQHFIADFVVLKQIHNNISDENSFYIYTNAKTPSNRNCVQTMFNITYVKTLLLKQDLNLKICIKKTIYNKIKEYMYKIILIK